MESNDPRNVTTEEPYRISRRQTLGMVVAGAGFAGMGSAGLATLPTNALAQEIETCGVELDIVLVLDYSGSIRNAGTWPDIQSGASDFIDVLADDNQIGIVTFGDAPKAYDFGSDEYLIKAQDGATDNRPTVSGTIPGASEAPPGENGTHMPGAIDLANDILDEQGRGGKEVIILLTDGEPNYQNGVVGDGSSPPADDGDDTVGGVSGWKPNSTDGFDPDGDTTDNTYSYTGGNAGGEDAIITDSERDETAKVAAMARGDSSYTPMGGGSVPVTPSDPTRIITVGIGGADDTYLANKVASDPSDHVDTTADQIGTELVGLLEELCDVCTVPLYAGQDIPVGTVDLSLSGDTLTVTYNTTGGWVMEETHLDVQEAFCDFPMAGKNNPKVGHFGYSDTHSPGVTTVTYDVDVSGFDDNDDDAPPPYLVAAHAVVTNGDESEEPEEETAWGYGCPFNEGRGGNWATYIVFDPDTQSCGCPEDYEQPSCDDGNGNGPGNGGPGPSGGPDRSNGRGNGRGR